MKFNDLIGIPYKKGGFDLTGADCWGLLLLFFRNILDIEIEMFEGAAFEGAELSAVIEEQLDESMWRNVERPAMGNVVVMYDKRNKRPEHIGIIASNGKVLHSYKKAGSTQTSLRTIKRMFERVEFYEYESKCSNPA